MLLKFLIKSDVVGQDAAAVREPDVFTPSLLLWSLIHLSYGAEKNTVIHSGLHALGQWFSKCGIQSNIIRGQMMSYSLNTKRQAFNYLKPLGYLNLPRIVAKASQSLRLGDVRVHGGMRVGG